MNTHSVVNIHVESEELALDQILLKLGRNARIASRQLAVAGASAKSAALVAAAMNLRQNAGTILAANALDMREAERSGANAAYLDRLMLTEARINGMAEGVEAIAALADPVGEIIAQWQQPNGLKFERVRTPLGVIGIIFESRPNVTADAGALCLKAGNAAILRAGSDSLNSAIAIHKCLADGLAQAGLSRDCIQLVPVRDRAAVGHLLSGLDGNIDVIVPRGGKSLVARVQSEARVPVFAHLDGVNHIYVHNSADLDKSRRVVLNSKMRRTGVCGAVETLLVDRSAANSHLLPILEDLIAAGCEIRATAEIRNLVAGVQPAKADDWATEYGDAIISVKLMENIDEAMAHIAEFGSQHTDAILAEDAAIVARFLTEVDSAIVLHNASTQFADGGEFGFGAEIGIATGRMHARGPVGVEQLTSFKYRVRGDGTVRP